jgi:hypothetical protein
MGATAKGVELMNWRDVPIPPRMRHLPKDKRGFPVFYVALVDRNGEPVFTANDSSLLARCSKRDLCAICGTKLFRFRWFVGGPLSAFDPRGAYADGPLHDDCMRYAMQVCPYLAAVNYSKDLAEQRASKVAAQGIAVITHAALKGQPPVFVCVKSTGTIVSTLANGLETYKPVRPVRGVEFWRGAKQISEQDARPLIADYIVARQNQEITESEVYFPKETVS